MRMAVAVARMSLFKLAEPTKGKRLVALDAGEIAIPRLALPAERERVQQVWARVADAAVPGCPQVGNWHALNRRLPQKQMVNRGMGGLGEALELPARRARLSAFPTAKPREAARKIIELHTGAIARPAQQRRLHLHSYPRRLRHDHIRRALT